MPRLHVLTGKRQGKVYEIESGAEHVVGHRPNVSVCIDDPWISWDHARLLYDASEATWWLEDLGSTNGTYLNCVRIRRERLRHEDVIFFGKTHVMFHGVSAPISLFGDASEPAGVPWPAEPPSQGRGGVPLGGASSGGAFISHSGELPLPGSGSSAAGKDPFESVGAQGAPAPLWSGGSGSREGRMDGGARAPSGDPFSDSSIDPFASGPGFDERRPPSGRDLFPPPPSGRARRSNPMADTHEDDELNDLKLHGSSRRRSLSLSEIQEDDGEPDLPGPSSQEIADLIENSGDAYAGYAPGARSSGLAAIPPRPAERRQSFDKSTDSLIPASEMRTRQVDTTRMVELLAEAEERGAPPPPPPPPPPPGPKFRAPLQPSRPAPMPIPAPADSPASTPTAEQAGAGAFERARLEAEVLRLRAALQVVQQKDPQAIQAAAAAFRDQELARLTLRVAELEREMAALVAERLEREQELNLVTDDMIEKEDLIETLRAELERLQGAARSTDLRSLEF